MKRMNTLAAGLFLLSQTLCGTAFAASVTLTGHAVDFTFDDALLGLFGQPGLSGDTLYFTPVDFKSKSLNGAGYALTSDTLNIKLTAHPGWSFSSIGLAEKGDYLLQGTGSQAAVSGQIRAFDTAHPLADVTASIQTGNLLDQMGLPTHNWASQTALDLSAWNATQAINVTVENILLASTGTASSVAFVEKKFVALAPSMLAVTPVPEADTYAMMLAGLGLVALAGARRRAI